VFLKFAEKVSDRHSACGAGVSIKPGAWAPGCGHGSDPARVSGRQTVPNKPR